MNLASRLLILGTTILVLAACARREEDPAEDAGAGADAAPAAGAAPAPREKVVADVHARITLSPAANAELKAKGDQVLVEAIFAGDPTPEASGQANELGLIELGRTSQPMSGAGDVAFDKSAIDNSRLPLIIGQPQLILNVRSQQGLIVCPMYWESVEVASRQTVEVSCRLPSEAAAD
ncbi:hypothetical protein [Luteimonas granuli]|uniref:Lipoprotein n=1 Tax=Luteimonas granuli TaxID=1176533 RepID=A0A518N341_9GAMM|nr:hypothetical protein [Luteimonas granuli]QDW66353.1 hypothetical protein FPZ22_05125 [Luteimonas granuli]